tara:strand:- start:23216 stop:25090 length:1875 start_codon:yes stop_codon:yes gene_type:complete
MRFVTDVPRPSFVDTPEKLEEAINRCASSKLLALDTETLGKQYKSLDDQVLYMGACPDESVRYFVPRHYVHHFKPVIESPHITKSFHNFKFDAHRLANAGLTVKGPVADSLVLDWLYDEDTRENRHSLDNCSWDYFQIPMAKYKAIVGNNDPRKIRPGHESWEKFLDYGSLDAWVTRKLALYLFDKLDKVPLWSGQDWTLTDLYWDMEEPQLRCLYEMERRGINIDTERLETVSKSLELDMERIAGDLCKLVGRPINPQSTKQVAQLLFEEKGIKPIKTTPKGAPSCDEASLDHYANVDGLEECKLIVKYRKAGKLLGTYAKGLLKHVQKDGHIHTSFSPLKVTGRLSSSEPNLQNIPRPNWDVHGIRAAFIPDEGCKLIVSDYAQLEMRIMAEASGDKAMIEGICAGRDMHSYTASLMMGTSYEDFMKMKEAEDPAAKTMRQAAKAVGFGIIYCIGPQKLASNLSSSLNRTVSVEEAEKYLNGYLAAFPDVKNQIDWFKNHAKKKGYVQTICGRFRRLSKLKSRKWGERGHAERQAVNTPIQGSAADIVKKSMIKCAQDAYLNSLGCTLRLQIHDELVFNCPEENAVEAAEIIKDYMENPFVNPLRVPLPAEPVIVDNWKEAK